MSVDRSSEFFEIADARCGGQPPRRRKPPRAPTTMAAGAIGRDLHAARGRIARLERLSKATSLFNDPVAEINQLTLLLKQDVTRLGAAVDALARTPVSGGRQPVAHRDAVVAMLRTELSAASAAFRTALADREASLSAREQRAARLASVATTPALPLATASALHRRTAATRRAPLAGEPARANGHDADVEAGSVAIDLEGASDPAGAPPQQSYWAPRSRVEREEALSTMQGTLTVRPRAPAPRARARACTHARTRWARARACALGACACPRRRWAARARRLPGAAGEAAKSRAPAQRLGAPSAPRARPPCGASLWCAPPPCPHPAPARRGCAPQELGSMFQRLSGLVAEQATAVARIDADVDAASVYVDDAQSQLQRYYRHIRGNRGLIVKAFVVLFIVMGVYAVVARPRR